MAYSGACTVKTLYLKGTGKNFLSLTSGCLEAYVRLGHVGVWVWWIEWASATPTSLEMGVMNINELVTSGPTPQVASSAAHMFTQANKERRKTKKEKKTTKKKHRAGFELGSSCSRTVCLTTRPREHEATGLTEHKHTYMYIHVLSCGGPIKMAAIPEVFVLLWEKTGELSDGYCFKL